MSSFNFQSIQSLEISAQDNPTIDVRDGRLVLTAERGQERIMITAPLQGILPKSTTTTVKTPTKSRKYITRRHGNVGSNNPTSKLTEESVRKIRELFADKNFVNSYSNITAMHEDIAKDYGVSAAAIYQVYKNITWKHVTV